MISRLPKIVSRTRSASARVYIDMVYFGRARDAEVVGRDPVADDQIVEADPKAVAADHLALIMINADDLRAAEPHVVVLGREVAQRVRHVPGVEAAGRHLIEQRLEGVVRELIEQGNPKALFG